MIVFRILNCYGQKIQFEDVALGFWNLAFFHTILWHLEDKILIKTQVNLSVPLSQVTGERYCRAQQEAHHDSHTYLCLLASTRNHLVLHNLYHGKGERGPEEVAGLVGLRLPTQPGGKGWEKWRHGRVQRWKKTLTFCENVADLSALVQLNTTWMNIWLEIWQSWREINLCCVALCTRGGNMIVSSESIWTNCKYMNVLELKIVFCCDYIIHYSCLLVLMQKDKRNHSKGFKFIFMLIYLSH